MRVRIELYGFLRNLVGSSEVAVEVPEGSTLGEVLSAASSGIPALQEAVDPRGRLKPYFLLFVNEVDYELLGGYGYVVRDGDSLQILPISHGGSAAPLEEYLELVGSVRVLACLVRGELAETLLGYVDSVDSRCLAQVIPRRYYYGARYSALAAYLALRSMELGTNISKKKSLEFLLYYFGDRQIGNVLKLLRSERSGEYVAIHACLPGAGSGDPFVRFVTDRCEAPEEPQRVPEEAIDRLCRVYSMMA